MSSRRAVLSQVLDLVHRETLDRLGARYDAHQRVRHFGLRQQLICMVFAQLTWREGLRDIEHCFNAKPEMLYHLGFREPVARSTLADANEKRNWRIWEALGKSLIAKAQKLYEGEELGLDLSNAIYALDSTTIDLSLTLFPWADFRSTKAGVKIHTQLDLRGSIPTCIHVTDARQHDVLWLDDIEFEATSFYVMDRGYVDYGRLGGLQIQARSSLQGPRTTSGSRVMSRCPSTDRQASTATRLANCGAKSPNRSMGTSSAE